jgi:hypothetical protein
LCARALCRLMETLCARPAQSGADGDGLFKTYRIESLNSNKIGFETDLAQFQRGLKVPAQSQLMCALGAADYRQSFTLWVRVSEQSAENAEVATMKLSSKNGHPFMIFEIISRTVRGALCGNCETRVQQGLPQAFLHPRLTISTACAGRPLDDFLTGNACAAAECRRARGHRWCVPTPRFCYFLFSSVRTSVRARQLPPQAN